MIRFYPILALTPFLFVSVSMIPSSTQAQGPFNIQQHNEILEKLDTLQESVDQLHPEPPCGPDTVGQRFVVSTDGTEVCDNTTGLIWDQMPDSVSRPWQDAVDHCPTLGGGYRLPFVKELNSLVDYSQITPALPVGHPFSNVQLANYWSATTSAGTPTSAWVVGFASGIVLDGGKSSNTPVWCVRGG